MITRVAKNRITNRRKKKYTFPTYNIDDIYKGFIKKQKTLEDQSKKIDLTLQQYKAIVHECNKELSEMIGTEGLYLALPYNLGEMGVIKRKVTYQDNEIKCMLDYAHYKKTGEKRLHINKEKDYTAKWTWRKSKCKVTNRNMYSFTPSRTNTNKIAQVMMKPFGYNTFLTKSKL